MVKTLTYSARAGASLFAAALAFGSLALACGGSSPGPAAPTAGGAAPASAAPAAWSDDMPMDQKGAFMKAKVAPDMAKVFQGMNASRYADFGCKTCHGPEGKDPPDFLPKLAMKDGKMTAFAEKPEIAKFMAEKVVPQMASILGKPAYDPATKSGFGCGGCHTIEMK
jgi:hypothetical protein